MNPRSTVVGVIMLASSPLLWSLVLFWPPTELFRILYLSGRSVFEISLLREGPFFALSVVGFVLYIAGRKRFWEGLGKHGEKSGLLAAVGLVLIVWGLWWSYLSYSSITYYAQKPSGSPVAQSLVDSFPSLLLYVFWLISGIPLLADGFQTLR